MIYVAAGFLAFLWALALAPKEAQQLALTMVWGSMGIGAIGCIVAAAFGWI